MARQLELPVFKARRSKDFPLFLIVECPRDNCPGTLDGRPFLVAERTWLRPQRLTSTKTETKYAVVGRSCPYCFRAARIPKRVDIG